MKVKFCPPLDDALFYAISSEYDLSRGQKELIEVLEIIKSTAIEQEDVEFDPSGTGGLIAHQDKTDTSKSKSDDDSFLNGVTSITSAISDIKWTEEHDLSADFEDLTDQEKEKWIHTMFPGVSLSKIIEISAQHQGDLDATVDELLNLAFIGDEHEEQDISTGSSPIPKGVDGFANELLGHKRKPRNKKKARTTDSSRASSIGSFRSETPTSPTNVWDAASNDVDFICSRTGLSSKSVKSVYHAKGARLSTTIRALAEKETDGRKSVDELDPILQLQLSEFKTEFEQVPDSLLIGLLILARNIPSAAYELLDAMMAPEEASSPKVGRISGLTSYAPINLSEDDEVSVDKHFTPYTNFSGGNTRELAAAHGIAASRAFSQASQAYKRGKSDRLMGGAAAYYSSVGHERLKVAKEFQSAAANAHVEAQSSATILDLHGASVADAVRIASYKTQLWWDNLGDAKYTSGGGGLVRAGYKIVTGVGSHSKNHAPRIGPAVSKMLVREGWRVEVGHGELFVIGKAKK